MSIEMPRGAAREYLRVFGVAAIYVAVKPEGSCCRVGMSLDLARTQTFLDRFEIDLVFWVRDAMTARRVMRKARVRLAMFGGLAHVSGQTAGEEIEAAAGRLGVPLTEHQAALARVTRALGRVEAVLAQAHADGTLSWFNRAYRAYRLASTGRTMLYGEAKVRLRNAVVRRIMAGETLADLQGEVFGKLSSTKSELSLTKSPPVVDRSNSRGVLYARA
ncbi:hypothetical protein I6F35_02890 [Bradyrhizobium sp. BRP22]|uniref:hypothetical protein n=1 Tax=Bradyrhizobium sp. BRP22 TaxID=2793821 RepID=UPI001CD34796|nr:hypothetical protein [Bradyrhizobium sp. BRP22]MCA1452161.1 hypothetical protein [Bradyrhizobium sp. BRP22]